MFWEKKTKIRKHIIFYGRVQGVGFRYYAVQKANQLGLTGWVKNLYDGSVEMEVEGEEPLIDELIIFLQNRTYVWIENMDAKSIPLEHTFVWSGKVITDMAAPAETVCIATGFQ